MLPKYEKTVYIRSVDICKRSICHIEKIKNYLEINNYRLVFEPKQADNILFFACSFNSTTEKNALLKLEELKGYTENLFVLEGIADTSRKKLEEMGVDHKKIIGRGEYEKLDEFFAQEYKFTEIEDANKTPENIEIFFVHACQGCKSNCSYCGEKIIVKGLKSKPIQDCIKEIEKGVSLGFKKILLIGDDLGAYGLDIDTSLMELLRAAMKVEGVFELFLEEINIKYLVRNLKELDKILSFGKIKKMLCGLQSANNRILKLMNREYTRQEMQNLVHLLLARNVEISFHMIVGFRSSPYFLVL